MKNNYLITSLILCVFVLLSSTQTLSQTASKVDHKAWDVLLKKHVDKNGLVAYKEFLNDQDQLTSYLNHLSTNVPDDSWSQKKQLAYYINLYNAATIDLILKNYPVKSIKEIKNPWKTSNIKMGEKYYSLGDIEHKILREMKEPRIHFAINCASYSCPKLLNEAFIASKMEEQLERVTLEFINSDKNDISPENPRLSKIFKWYKKDFIVKGEQGLIAYINKYSNIKIDVNTKVEFMDYDWNLNEME